MQDLTFSLQLMQAVSRLSRVAALQVHKEVSNAEYLMLSAVREALAEAETPGVYAADIAKSREISPAAVSKMLLALENKQLISRSTDPNCRRNTFINLTPLGQEVLHRADLETAAYIEHLLAGIDKQHIDLVLGMLNQVLDTIEKDIHEWPRE